MELKLPQQRHSKDKRGQHLQQGSVGTLKEYGLLVQMEVTLMRSIDPMGRPI